MASHKVRSVSQFPGGRGPHVSPNRLDKSPTIGAKRLIVVGGGLSVHGARSLNMHLRHHHLAWS